MKTGSYYIRKDKKGYIKILGIREPGVLNVHCWEVPRHGKDLMYSDNRAMPTFIVEKQYRPMGKLDKLFWSTK